MQVTVCLRHALIVSTGLLLPLACSSSKDDAATNATSQPGTCEGFVDREVHFCPDSADQRDGRVEICDGDLADYASVGCGNAYATWLGCGARATWDCDYGPAGCDDEQSGYFTCLSQFVQRTGCTYTARSPSCPTDKPNTFGCLSAKPPYDTCVPVPGESGGAPRFCCP